MLNVPELSLRHVNGLHSGGNTIYVRGSGVFEDGVSCFVFGNCRIGDLRKLTLFLSTKFFFESQPNYEFCVCKVPCFG
jgi:hypothetical protein